MFISFEVILFTLFIFIAGLIISCKIGEKYGSDTAYDMGYKDCEKDWFFDKKLKFEFEDFLASKGYTIDKSSDLKTLKTLKTLRTNK